MSWNERLPYWIAILLLILFIRQCTGSKPCAPCEPVISASDVRIDTFYITDTLYVPSYIPELTGLVIPFQDTASVYADIDTSAIIADYDKQRMYRDSQQIVNGYVIIYDTVTQNRIKGRSLIANISTPVIKETTTITLSQKEKPRTQMYLGIGAYGNKTIPINAAGASLMLKTKRDRIYEAGAFIDWKGTVWYYGGMKFKIKIK